MKLLVKQYRQVRKMTQMELSKKSGVKQSIIADIELEKTKSPTIETLLRIAKAFECKVDDLISN